MGVGGGNLSVIDSLKLTDTAIEFIKEIYYITGESKAAVENSPFLEKLKAQNLEKMSLRVYLK